MNREIFTESMSLLKGRVPFHPFTVALVNGDRFEVDFPDALSIRDGAAVYLKPRGIPVIFDHEGVNQIEGDLLQQGLNPDDPKE
jgi:hypothetical protein